jgi:hypothetical protein
MCVCTTENAEPIRSLQVKETEIILGEKTYRITQLPLRANVKWQRKVAEQARPILAAVPSLMTALGPVLQSFAPQNATRSVLDAINDQTLPALLDTGSNLLLGAIDAMPVMLDLIYEFDPALGLDREAIEANVTEEEVIAAFVAIVKLSFPFGAKLGDLVKSLQATTATSGGTTATILPTSPLPSGDAGMTSSGSSRLPA